MRQQISMHCLDFGLSASNAWYLCQSLICFFWINFFFFERFFCWINLSVFRQLKPASWTGRTRWNMDLATHKSVVQLASTCSPNWEENYLHAWWHWSVYKSCRTDWEPTAPNCNGSRLSCSHGFIVVSKLLYLICVLVQARSMTKPIKMVRGPLGPSPCPLVIVSFFMKVLLC